MEDIWIEEDVEQGRTELDAPSAEKLKLTVQMGGLGLPCYKKQSREGTKASAVASADEGTAEEATEDPMEYVATVQAAVRREGRLRDIITEALDLAEHDSEQVAGYMGDMPYMLKVQDVILEWSRSCIQCQLCRIRGWSETYYLHEVTACDVYPAASKQVRETLEGWAGLCGGGGGEGKQSRRCHFPLAACRPGRYVWGEEETDRDDSKHGGGRCYGVEVMKRTMAAPETVEDGLLGEVAVEREMRNRHYKEAAWRE